MSQINTNVGSLLAQRVLAQQNRSMSQTLERLSTGLAINRGADNPAGLIASEKLRSEKAALDAAIGNAERADQVVNIAEGGLQEVNNMLTELQGLVTETANESGLSREEREANQLQIDSILQTIDRIASTTSFQGSKLLNGAFDFTASGVSEQVRDHSINSAKLTHGEHREVDVLITGSAQHGTLFLSAGGPSLDLDGPDSQFTFDIGGVLGSRQFTFASGTSLENISQQVNSFSSVTGVSAAASGDHVIFKAMELGSDDFVSFKVNDDGGQAGAILNAQATDENAIDAATARELDTLNASAEVVRDRGEDVDAVINGMAATSRGAQVSINTDTLDLSLTLTREGAQQLQDFRAMSITGGGARFNLGPRVDIQNQVSIGIGDVAVRNLGSRELGGFLADLGAGRGANVVDGDRELAQRIVDKAIDQVSALRGRLGAFQRNTIGTTIRALGVAVENTSAAESSIRDTDFAAETAELTRSQIMAQAATNSLALANNQPQAVLSLLG